MSFLKYFSQFFSLNVDFTQCLFIFSLNSPLFSFFSVFPQKIKGGYPPLPPPVFQSPGHVAGFLIFRREIRKKFLQKLSKFSSFSKPLTFAMPKIRKITKILDFFHQQLSENNYLYINDMKNMVPTSKKLNVLG